MATEKQLDQILEFILSKKPELNPVERKEIVEKMKDLFLNPLQNVDLKDLINNPIAQQNILKVLATVVASLSDPKLKNVNFDFKPLVALLLKPLESLKNPNAKLSDIKQEMKERLRLFLLAALTQFAGKNVKPVSQKEIEKLADTMADKLAEGFMKEFKQKDKLTSCLESKNIMAALLEETLRVLYGGNNPAQPETIDFPVQGPATNYFGIASAGPGQADATSTAEIDEQKRYDIGQPDPTGKERTFAFANEVAEGAAGIIADILAVNENENANRAAPSPFSSMRSLKPPGSAGNSGSGS